MTSSNEMLDATAAATPSNSSSSNNREQAAAHDALAHALLRFEALGGDALHHELLEQRNDDPQESNATASELDNVQALTELLEACDATALSQETHASLVEVAKTLCRTTTACIASVASRPHEDVAGFLRLDSNVTPVFAFLAAFTASERTTYAARSLSAGDQKALRRWIPFVVLACAHIVCDALPAADAMRAYTVAETTLEHSCAIVHAPTSAHLVTQYISELVALCSQTCSKDAWVARHAFPKLVLRWLVLQVPAPHLGGDLLGRVLALVFPLMDDLSDETQAVGAAILRHVVASVTATELRWYTDVLLDVLRRAITTRSPETLDIVLETLAMALDKLSPPTELAHYDAFVPRLLNDASLSSDVAIRIVYIRHLRPVIARMGAPGSIHIFRYLQPLLKVLTATFESIHVPLLRETLATLRVAIVSAWPRVPAHSEMIVVGVLRVVAFCLVLDARAAQPVSKAEHDELLVLCEDIFALLHDLTREPQDAAPEANRSAVVAMLERVAAESAALRPFCERMTGALQQQHSTRA